MSFQCIYRSSPKNNQTSSSPSIFAPRTFSAPKVQREATPKELENQAFEQDKLEVQVLQLREQRGTITSEESEKLTVLQAKTDSFLQKKMAAIAGQPNILEILANKSRSIKQTQPVQPVRPQLIINQINRATYTSSPTESLQPKLTVGQPNDQYEQEADEVAERVMSMSPPSTPNIQRQSQQAWTTNINQKPIASSSITPLVSRKPESEEEEAIQTKCDTCEQEDQIQRSACSSASLSPSPLQASSNGTTQEQPSLESRLNNTKGGGSALADGVRNFMEPRFGANFSQVRVHTGSEAVQMNRELGAQAFANGSDIYFGQGKAPGNNDLTAHELTHVVHQTGVGNNSAVQKKNDENSCSCPECSANVTQLKSRSVHSLNTVNGTFSNTLEQSLIQMNGDRLEDSGHELTNNQPEQALSQSSLPQDLKANIESMSGYSLDDVQVHLNSSKPAELNALAYTQGTDIYVSPGQEKHLPHEAWHVAQQKQGRVQGTAQMQGMSLNDDPGLEKEADEMGEKALQRKINSTENTHQNGCGCPQCTVQMKMEAPVSSYNPLQLMASSVIQRVPFQEENDRTVLQGDATSTSCSLTLEQLVQLFTMNSPSISYEITNRDGNSQTVRFTNRWIYGDSGQAVIRGRVRYEIDQIIGQRQQEIEGLLKRLKQENNSNQDRIEELHSYLTQSSTRYRQNDGQTVESSSALVEEAFAPGSSAFLARGYNYSEFTHPDTHRRGPNTQGIQLTVNSWEEALAREPDMRAAIRARGFSDAEIDYFHEQRLARSRRSAGLNEYNQHLIRLHAAWDISGRTGTAVYAPIAGIVEQAHQIGRRRSGSGPGYGNFIRIRHDQVPTFGQRESAEHQTEIESEVVYTNYCHLSELLVEQGQRIHPGQAIGLMGHSGLPGGTHLHFSVTRGNETTSEEEVRSSINPQVWWTQVTGNPNPYQSQIQPPEPRRARRRSRRRTSATETVQQQSIESVQSIQQQLIQRAVEDSYSLGEPVRQSSADNSDPGLGHITDTSSTSSSSATTVQRKSIQSAESLSNPIVQRVAEGCRDITTTQIATAIRRNNDRQFRIDWVRNLQLELIDRRVSTDGNFDEATIRAIADFQTNHFDACRDVDGIIGADTRRTLEATYPRLLTTVTGSHLQPRELVPGGASDEQKYDYYQSIIAESGGHFLTDPMAINLLGIRGIERRQDNSIWQTSSAQDFVTARAAGTNDDHLRWTAFDDLIVSLWLDAENNKHVSERMGSVDPSDAYTDTDRPGTAHLRDGQYQYRTGRHRTSSPTHVAAVDGNTPEDGIAHQVGRREVGTDDRGRRRIAYDALIPARRQEVWRESRARDTNDLHLDHTEEAESQEAIYRGNSDYFADNFAINIHTSSTTRGNSESCQNVPADQYVAFIEEIRAASNRRNILYTLIDASKIDSGLVLVSTEAIDQPSSTSSGSSELIDPWADESAQSSTSSELINSCTDEPAQQASAETSYPIQAKIDQQTSHTQGCSCPSCMPIQLTSNVIQRQAVIQRVTEEERYENTLHNAGTTRGAWDSGYQNSSFLGVNIRNGIHQQLSNRLALAQTYLRGLFPGRSDAEIANEIGLYSVSGRRPVRSAVGGSKLSFHSFGLAIDVNYSGNPFIGRNEEVNQIINRIFQFMTGNEFHIRASQSGNSEEIRSRYAEVSQAFATYFRMRGDTDLIRQHLASRGEIIALPTDSELLNPWETEGESRVQEIFDQIEADATNQSLLDDMRMNDGGMRPLSSGFIDLSQALVEALTNHAGLYWGGTYQTGKDIMHFDWRMGIIRDSHRQ